MNKIYKFLVFQILFFLCFSDMYAFSANLQLDKKQADINDNINLRVEVSSDEGGQIGVTQIKGIENFEIISQSQSQSSSSNVVVVNGKTESKTESKVNLDLTLKAKTKGDFEIGPAILTDGSGQITTNSVKVSVTGDNLFINNDHLNVNTQNNSGNTNQNNVNQNPQTSSQKEDDYIGDYEKTDKRNFDDNNSLYLLIGVLAIILLVVYFTLKKNPELLENIIKSEDKNNKNNDLKNDNEENVAEKVEIENNQEVKIEKVDTKITNEEIKFPEISDDKFISKIDNIFRIKLGNKYLIKNVENKTYDEILKFVDEKNEQKVQEIINLLNKAKYSNISGNNERILELVENI